MSDIPIGYRVKDYVLVKMIGDGSFAEVWLCYCQKDRKFFAMKIQNEFDYEDAEKEVALMKELGKNQVPHFNYLVESFDHRFRCRDDDDDSLCMVFPLMAGSLYDLMRSGEYSSGFPFETVQKMFGQLVLAMNELHLMGIIHTDIKPENILLEGVSTQNEEMIHDTLELFNSKKKRHQQSRQHELQQNLEKLVEGYESSESESSSDSDVSTDSDYSDEEYGIHLGLNNQLIGGGDSSSESSSDSDDESVDGKLEASGQLVSSKYVSQPHIRLSDFGSAIYATSPIRKEVQTRYYRSPEVILGRNYDHSCDVWSLGCTLFELLTGEILFDPGKSAFFSRDHHHLLEIIHAIGPIPLEMIKESKRGHLFFDVDGMLRGYHPDWLEKHCSSSLEERLKELDSKVPEKWLGPVKQLLTQMLQLQNRVTTMELLKTNFVKEVLSESSTPQKTL